MGGEIKIIPFWEKALPGCSLIELSFPRSRSRNNGSWDCGWGCLGEARLSFLFLLSPSPGLFSSGCQVRGFTYTCARYLLPPVLMQSLEVFLSYLISCAGLFFLWDNSLSPGWAILVLYPGCDFNLDKGYWEVPVYLSLAHSWIGILGMNLSFIMYVPLPYPIHVFPCSILGFWQARPRILLKIKCF